jgi:endo-1,4-beta-D-glucanase Y
MAILVPKRPIVSLSLLVFLAPLFACRASRVTLDKNDWLLYQQRFISPEGRVIDTGNGNTSHSEGQGFGMLLAVAYRDRQTFDRLWNWTTTNLQVRSDKLFAWNWAPSQGEGAVRDYNNASDGDLLIAWALCRASKQWAEPTYRVAATTISQDIRSKLLQQRGQAVYLLPGAEGFEDPAGITVNLSYWIFPAFTELQQIDTTPVWEQLTQTGLELLQTARFGRWQLPPDWLTLKSPPIISKDFSPVFGYNAIRIPLYLIWAKHEDHRTLQPYLEFWTYFHGAVFTPAWTNLLDNSVDSYDAPAGIHAIAALVETVMSTPDAHPPHFLPLDSTQDYYSASLSLLARLAATERGWP